MDRSKHRFDSILETIGYTPVVKIKKLAPAHISLYVKIEAFNPMGSVKDRLALPWGCDHLGRKTVGILNPVVVSLASWRLHLEIGS